MPCQSPLEDDEFTESPITLTDLLELHPFQAKLYSPRTRGALVAAVLAAAGEGRSLRAAGSLYSLSPNHVADNLVAMTFLQSHLSQPYPRPRGQLTPERLLPGADELLLSRMCAREAADLPGRHFVFVEAGIQIKQLLTDLKRCGLALPTMGAGGGQTLSGAVSTGTHGGDFEVSPLGDWIRAILLVGPGGIEWWITPADPLFPGEKAREHLPQWCAETRIAADDNLFDAARVAVGRAGVAYAVILEVVPDYALFEINLEHSWPSIRDTLAHSHIGAGERTGIFDALFTDLGGGYFEQAYEYVKRQKEQFILDNPGIAPTPVWTVGDVFPELASLQTWIDHWGLHRIAERLHGSPAKPLRHLNIGVNLSRPDQCWITRRWAVPIGTGQADLTPKPPTGVAKAVIEHPRSPVEIGPVLWDQIKGDYSDLEIALGNALGCDNAEELVDNFRPQLERILQSSTTSGEAIVLILYRLATNPVLGPQGRPQVIAAVSQLLADSFSPVLRLGHACDMLDTHNYALDGAQSGNSAEFIFDAGLNYQSFIDTILQLARDRLAAGRPVFGYIGIRFTPKSSALIAMQRYDLSVSVEIATGRARQDDIYAGFWDDVHAAARTFGAIPHWGQEFRIPASDLAGLYGDRMRTWRMALATLTDAGQDVFSTAFSRTNGLEPLSVKAIRARLRILNDSARQLQSSGHQDRSAGLGYEAERSLAELGDLRTTADDSADMAGNLIYLGAYLAAGDEAVAVTAAGVQLLRDAVAAQVDSPAYLNGLSWALHNLTARYNSAGNSHGADGLGYEAAQLPERFTATEPPADVRSSIASNLIYIGAYLPAGQEAVDVTVAGVAVYRYLNAAHPDNAAYLDSLSWALHNLTARHNGAGNPQGAAGLGHEAARLPERFVTTGAAENVRADVASNLVYVGAYLAAGQEAVDVTAAGVAVYRDLHAAFPDNFAYLDSLSWALHNLVARYNGAGNPHGADGLGYEAAQLAAGLTHAEAKARADVASNLIYVGAYLPAGQEAVDVTEAGVVMYQALVTEFPGDQDHAAGLKWAGDNLAARMAAAPGA
ncbi:D-arabinono-1,4-lactone oxidase [Nocardia pseudobrasiliensis]|uniref:D-arabinono-1,4-lactone oxidase n=1 Tax=Nocardia pseudobrasiliensis TaxID=45979 RepID=A0A370I4A5_9NOCA|nr:D-arabinono-1,4-lactone oxidase [Nocardia pseudobrasiliensis]RDI65567.1 D-arabinono-1,4-lactone oxidase [Nocardia pseudobrasiliensis]